MYKYGELCMHTQEVVCTGLSEGVCVHMVECTAHRIVCTVSMVPILGIGGGGGRAGGSTVRRLQSDGNGMFVCLRCCRRGLVGRASLKGGRYGKCLLQKKHFMEIHYYIHIPPKRNRIGYKRTTPKHDTHADTTTVDRDHKPNPHPLIPSYISIPIQRINYPLAKPKNPLCLR